MTYDVVINYFWICNFYLKYQLIITYRISIFRFLKRFSLGDVRVRTYENLFVENNLSLCPFWRHTILSSTYDSKSVNFNLKSALIFSGTNGTAQFIRQGFPGGSVVKNLPVMQETWVQSLSGEDPLEKGMAIQSSIFAWRIP